MHFVQFVIHTNEYTT